MAEMSDIYDGERSPSTPGTGYLGSTSFSAVLDEDRNARRLRSSLQDDRLEPEKDDYIDEYEDRVQEGARVLSYLSEMPVFEPLIRAWHADVDGSTSKYTLILKVASPHR